MIFGQTAGAAVAEASGGAASVQENGAEGAGAKSGAARLALGLVAVWAMFATLTLWNGSLTLTLHEGDATHLAAIVLRLAGGEWPHLDYMTPIGIGALAPIAAFVSLDWGLGQAFLLSQAAVAAVLLPALWWVGMTRFGGGLAGFAFGAFAIALCMALVHGGADASVSVSMHYNRWAWAVTYVLLALLFLPSERRAPAIEGMILGLGFAFLALTKATYFAGLLPVALVALALRRDGPLLMWAVVAGLAVVGAMTALAGTGFWGAYIGDLVAVATSESRPSPGMSATEVLSAPTHLAGTLVLLASVAILRRTGRATEGALLLAAVPGFTLITWQNFGNDPQWLPFLALSLVVLRPAGQAGQPYIMAALVAGALALPSALNVAMSPMRLMAAWADESSPLLMAQPAHYDYRIADERLKSVRLTVPSPTFAEPAELEFWGAPLPDCELRHGGVRTYGALVDELEAAGFGGRPAFITDTVQSLWLFGDFPPLAGGAPWYYDGLPGGMAAEIVVVPLCPTGADVRTRALAALEATGWTVQEVFRGEYSAVLEITAR